MQEGVVQVLPFKWRHAAILSCLSVEDEVDAEKCGTKDAGAVEQSLPNVTIRSWINGCLWSVMASEGRLENISRLRQSSRLDLGLLAEDARLMLQWRGREEARNRRLRSSRSLTYRRRDGEGPPEHESHVVVVCWRYW